jgi:glutaminase
VAGGIVAVVPGVLGIGLYSPRLDAKGNSVRGVEACRELSQRFGLHAFESHFSGEKLMDLFALKRGR